MALGNDHGIADEFVVFGQAIAQFQNTQFMLADMATDLEAARALLRVAALKVTEGSPVDLEGLRAADPGLVTVAITPWGQTGPKASWRGE